MPNQTSLSRKFRKNAYKCCKEFFIFVFLGNKQKKNHNFPLFSACISMNDPHTDAWSLPKCRREMTKVERVIYVGLVVSDQIHRPLKLGLCLHCLAVSLFVQKCKGSSFRCCLAHCDSSLAMIRNWALCW